MKIRYLALSVCIAGWSLAASGVEPRFDGVMIAADRPLFVLSVGDTKSAWLSLGATFREYTITAFDPHGEIVTLEKGGTRIAIPLRQSQVTAAAAPDADAALRNLTGVALAYEIARRGDEEISDLLRRYQEAIASSPADKPIPVHVGFLKDRLEKMAREKAVQRLSVKK